MCSFGVSSVVSLVCWCTVSICCSVLIVILRFRVYSVVFPVSPWHVEKLSYMIRDILAFVFFFFSASILSYYSLFLYVWFEFCHDDVLFVIVFCACSWFRFHVRYVISCCVVLCSRMVCNFYIYYSICLVMCSFHVLLSRDLQGSFLFFSCCRGGIWLSLLSCVVFVKCLYVEVFPSSYCLSHRILSFVVFLWSWLLLHVACFCHILGFPIQCSIIVHVTQLSLLGHSRVVKIDFGNLKVDSLQINGSRKRNCGGIVAQWNWVCGKLKFDELEMCLMEKLISQNGREMLSAAYWAAPRLPRARVAKSQKCSWAGIELPPRTPWGWVWWRWGEELGRWWGEVRRWGHRRWGGNK